MGSMAIQWGFFITGLLLLINCKAFVMESTTEQPLMRENIAHAETEDNNKYEHVSHITQPNRSSDDQMVPTQEQIINVVKDPTGQLEAEERTLVTYKDLCQILGNYQLNKQNNHYDVDKTMISTKSKTT